MPTGNPEGLENFLFTHEYLFRQQTARFYPLSFERIEQYPGMWDFSLLCRNPHIAWDLHTLGRFETRIDWQALSANTSLRWTDEILERYRHRLHWLQLSQNPSFPFTDAVLEKYTNEFSWICLSSNPALPLSDAFLDKYQDRLHWQILKNHNRHLDRVSPRFQAKMAELADTPNRSNYILPDHMKRYIKWNVVAESLPVSQEMLDGPVSQLSEDVFDRLSEYWDWRSISSCIHLRWSISFFERFYRYLDAGVTTNPAFYTQVLEPGLNNDLIGKVCARLNPENVLKFYYLEDKRDEFGMLPHVRYTLPGDSPYEAYRRVYDQFQAFFSSRNLDVFIPEVHFELSWFLRHPIRFADYHQWPFEDHHPAIVVSGKMKYVLEQFKLPPHRFYKIELAIADNVFGTESRDYYILFVPEQDYLYYDYHKTVWVEDEDRKDEPNRSYHKTYYDSSYFTRQMASPYPGEISSPEEFLEAKEELSFRQPDKKLRPQEYIWNADFDLISSKAENPRRSIWISEDLKKAMEIAGLEGIRFERVMETRPRMLGLENPECRKRNEAVLQSLQAEFLNAPPLPEQITVRNFRAAEIWAEEVCRNEGIVKRLFEGSPANDATSDAFLQKIREKEMQFDVVFPDWFVKMLKSGKLPRLVKEFTIKPLEEIYCQQLVENFPLIVKSVVFAEYGTSVLFLVLKRDSLYELDDAIWQHEFDQGPPPWVVLRVDKNGKPIK